MFFDRDVYFNEVRTLLFEGALTQQQVDGQNLVLGLWEHQDTGTPMDDLRWLSYMLATVFHETAQRMWPNTEMGSDAYLQATDYWPYIGRGFVHLTWESNYKNASAALGLIGDRDLVEHPDLALDSLIAARIMFRGMAEGWFTGQRLNDYFDADTDDPKNARQIINGNDCDTLIMGYYQQFFAAINMALLPDPVKGKVVFMDITVPQGVTFELLINGEAFHWPP